MATPQGVFVHPHALCESEQVGEGTRVWAFAHVMKGAKVGKGCNLCDHSFVESGAVLGDNVTVKNSVSVWDCVEVGNNVFIGPNAVFTNDLNPRAEVKKPREQWVPTRIKDGASIGANATIVCGITLGRYAFVAAGAVVASDVPDFALVMGVPARPRGWMCKCGERLKLKGTRGRCGKCGSSFVKTKQGLREK
ncbi:MAG TPA: acyltransferase [Terriglobales bacterium]|nr:acyltransferase [Terriglobales bacterium]